MMGYTMLYNPESIIKYLNNGKALNYWIGSGNPTMEVNILKNEGTRANIEKLFKEEKIDAYVEPNSDLGFLLYAGYLTSYGEKDKVERDLAIPNMEIKKALTERYNEAFFKTSFKLKFDGISKRMGEGINDFDKFLKAMEEALELFELDDDCKEADFAAFLAILTFMGGYESKSKYKMKY